MEPPSHACTSTHLEEEDSTPGFILLFLVIFLMMMGSIWYVRCITTWVRHCVCDPSLPPYEGLMRIGFGKFDDENLGLMIMANLVRWDC